MDNELLEAKKRIAILEQHIEVLEASSAIFEQNSADAAELWEKYCVLQKNNTELKEMYEIVLKTARRVTRDLNHAIDQIPTENQFKQMMYERYLHFKTIFDDISDYRQKLHLEIKRLNNANSYLTKELERAYEPVDKPGAY